MDNDAFWALVERSRQAAPNDLEKQTEALKKLLAELSGDEMRSFDQLFVEANAALYTWNMWGAAIVILGWCSEDVFADFRNWVISRGRKTYDEVIADPDAMANVDLAGAENVADGEIFASAANEVHEEATDLDLWEYEPGREAPEAPHGEPAGDRFERTDEELRRRYPRLAARWMTAHGGTLPGQLPRSF